jgi:hypothetical protein
MGRTGPATRVGVTVAEAEADLETVGLCVLAAPPLPLVHPATAAAVISTPHAVKLLARPVATEPNPP